MTHTDDGLRALSPDETTLLRTLDAIIESWGTDDGAASMIMPAVLPVADLAMLDFYENFPHQAYLACTLDLDQDAAATGSRTAFPTIALEPAVLGLPSAACFAVYLHHRGAEIPDRTTVTVLGRCFRREERYDGLRRLLGFHMREVVALGSYEFVTEHLRTYRERIRDFASALGLPGEFVAATDPFYDKSGQRALLQRLSPVKHEYVVDDLAIASLNVHRNFFGERCDIRLAGPGTPVFTGCAAFGLERWLAVLAAQYGDFASATDAVRGAAEIMIDSVFDAAGPIDARPRINGSG